MEQKRIAALIEHVEGLVSSVTTPENPIARDRLQEAVQLCSRMDAAVLPVGLILAATAALDRPQVESFLRRFPAALSTDSISALGRISETLLMITDADLQASGAIASSVFVLRALPDAIVSRDRILETLLVLTEGENKARAVRHREIFTLLAQVKDRLTLEVLPRLLVQVSDALEDLACEKDVFLDNPVELIPKGEIEVDLSEERFKEARVKSGANIPPLREEVEQIEVLKNELNWTRGRAFMFVADLYQRNVMDSKSKLGLSVLSICDIVHEVKETVATDVKDIRIERRLAGTPYSYDWDTSELLLQVGERGSITGRSVKDARERILGRLTSEKTDRETSALDKAIDRYRKARAAAGFESADDETAEVKALSTCLNIPLDQTYHTVASLYGVDGVTFSVDGSSGISLQRLRETIEAAGESGSIRAIGIDSEVDGRVPFRIDTEAGVLKLHSRFQPLSDATLRRCVAEQSNVAFELVEPDPTLVPRYNDAEKPGSLADAQNVLRFIDEFQLDPELAADSFEVMSEGCAGLQESVSIQTLRVVVASLNARLGTDSPVKIVTAFSRELPDSQKTDNASIAWLSSHTEEDSTLIMLTFNFNYGEGGGKLPSYSDGVLLEWCRHYRVEAIAKSE